METGNDINPIKYEDVAAGLKKTIGELIAGEKELMNERGDLVQKVADEILNIKLKGNKYQA